MKSASLIALSGLAAFAYAESPSSTVDISPTASCAAKCNSSDICCLADCAGVPCPNDAMANRTTECAAQCPQGSGSPEDAVKYGECQSSCVKSYFLTGTATLPGVTSSGDSTSSGNSDAKTTASDGSPTKSNGSSESETGSATNSAAESNASESEGAAPVNIPLGSSAAGIVGIMMAALAL